MIIENIDASKLIALSKLHPLTNAIYDPEARTLEVLDQEQADLINEQFASPDLLDRALLVDKTALKANIDVAAESERLRYITPGNGQAMTYQQKVTEAQSYKVATKPQDSEYPMLSSEVGITADTLGEVADIVLAAFAQWQQVGALIESIRLGAKRDIDAAKDEAAARAIVDAVEWPSEA